jgi:hypothetical protein
MVHSVSQNGGLELADCWWFYSLAVDEVTEFDELFHISGESSPFV